MKILFFTNMKDNLHCVKSVQIRTEYGPNTGKCKPEKTPYLDTFHAVLSKRSKRNVVYNFSFPACKSSSIGKTEQTL